MRPRAGRENTSAPLACAEGDDDDVDDGGDATVSSCPRGPGGCGIPHVLDVSIAAACCCCCCWLEGITQCTAEPPAGALSALLSLPPLAQAPPGVMDRVGTELKMRAAVDPRDVSLDTALGAVLAPAPAPPTVCALPAPWLFIRDDSCPAARIPLAMLDSRFGSNDGRLTGFCCRCCSSL